MSEVSRIFGFALSANPKISVEKVSFTLYKNVFTPFRWRKITVWCIVVEADIHEEFLAKVGIYKKLYMHEDRVDAGYRESA